MDEAEYKEWWKLHRRHAMGETLNSDEEAVYQEGKQRLYAEEKLNYDLTGLKQMREEIKRIEAEREKTLAQYELAKKRVLELEARLDEETKQALGIGT